MTAPKVFISYRRQDAAMPAGRLYDAMALRFGDDNVFMDLEIPPGVDFVEYIRDAVSGCRVLLVVIGPEWMGERIAQPGDFVRLEVELGLRAGVTVIPVLVGGAQMPSADELPEPLRRLAHRNAFVMSELHWRFDCARLMTELDKLLGDGETGTVTSPPPWGTLLQLWVEGVALAVAAGVLARLLGNSLTPSATASDTTKLLLTVARRAEVWALVAATLAVWLSLRRGDRSRMGGRLLAGLLLGAVAGAIGGAIYGVQYLPNVHVGSDNLKLLAIASLVATGAILGTAIGALWIPRRTSLGLLGGALGGALVQVAINGADKPPPDVLAAGYDCLAIVGVTLALLLLRDVRAAAARPAVAAHAAAT